MCASSRSAPAACCTTWSAAPGAPCRPRASTLRMGSTQASTSPPRLRRCVLDPGDLRQLIAAAKRGPLVTAGSGVAVSVGSDGLQRLLPHRPPMLLVDGIDTVDLANRAVRGHRLLRPDD